MPAPRIEPPALIDWVAGEPVAAPECDYVDIRDNACSRTANITTVYVDESTDVQWCGYHTSNYASQCNNCNAWTSDNFDSGCADRDCSSHADDEDEWYIDRDPQPAALCSNMQCRECYPASQSSNYNPIHDYYFKPTPAFHGDGPSFYGFELEVETGDNRVRSTGRKALESFAGNATDLAYLKHDSSIESGFEMVTHPMSYPWAMENFPFDVLDVLKAHRARAASSCGLHIHVNRDGFSSPTHAYRWLKFWYRNERGISAIARRSDSHWAAFAASERSRVKRVVKPNLPDAWSTRLARSCAVYEPLHAARNAWLWHDTYYQEGRIAGHSAENFPQRIEYNAAMLEYRAVRDHGRDDYGAQRYSAVNTTNDATFEMRVFASTLETQQLQAALGLASATVEYTRKLTSTDIIRNDGWGWPAFRAWVSDRPDYNPLAAEMSARCAS